MSVKDCPKMRERTFVAMMESSVVRVDVKSAEKWEYYKVVSAIKDALDKIGVERCYEL